MQSRNTEYPFGQGFNFSVDSLNSYDYTAGHNVPPPPGNNFLLSDGSGFLLSDGSALLLS
jgi:hypothetical protein